MEKFKSKIDIWLVLFLVIIFGGSIIIMISDRTWGALIFILLVAAFIVHIFTTTFYIIDNKKLIIKCGFLVRISIEVETIKKISETNSIMSSPALSFDRLEIIYNKFDAVLISPKEKSKFMKAIQKINPGVEVNTKKNFNNN